MGGRFGNHRHVLPTFSSFFRGRHPGDLLRLVLGAAILLLTAVAVEQDRVGRFETNLFRLINDLPDPSFLYPVVWSIMQLGNLGAVDQRVGSAHPDRALGHLAGQASR